MITYVLLIMSPTNGVDFIVKNHFFLNNQLQKLPFTCHIQPLQWLYAKESHSFSSPCSVSTWNKCCEMQIHSSPWHLNSRSLGRKKINLIAFSLAWCLAQAAEAMCLLKLAVLSSDSLFLSSSPSPSDLLYGLTSSLSFSSSSSKLFKGWISHSAQNSSFSHLVQQQNRRMFKSLCTNSFNFHGGIFYGPRPAWALFVWDIPILPFLEDPSLGFELSSCLAELFPGRLPVLWGTPGISLEPKFSSLMPSSSFLGEPQLQGCSLLPRAGSYSSLEHWLQKLLF